MVNEQLPPPSWTVLRIEDTTDVPSSGNAVRGSRVYFQTGSGAQSSVFVPQEQLTPDVVRKAIMDKAASLEGIMGLSAGQ